MKKILYLFLLVILSINVHSIGLRGNDFIVDINFEPGFDQTYTYNVVPYNTKPIDIILYAKNDINDETTTNMSKYFILSQNVIKNVIYGEEPQFSVRVKLPDQINEPGTHNVRVGALEGDSDNPGMFRVLTAVEAIFAVHVPFEGKYLRVHLQTRGVNQNEPVPVNLTVTNLGTLKMESLYAKLFLVNSQNQTVGETTTKTISLTSQETKKLNATIITAGLPPGKYSVRAKVYYDGEERNAEKDIKIGYMSIRIINQTEEIFSGKINQMFVEAESDWADPIENVYGNIIIKGISIKTFTDTFNAFEKKNLVAFFDATNIEPGIYDMSITLHYGDRTTTKNTLIKISKDNTRFALFNGITLTNILFLIIIMVILIINIILFTLLSKKMREYENK